MVGAILASLGKPRARIQIVSNPRITGFSSLLANLCDVVQRYAPQVDAIVVAFDTDGEDGEDGRPNKAARVRNALSRCPSPKVAIVGAIQELEVWALWGSRAQIDSSWGTVRAERDPKERYFDRLLTRADALLADGGRTRLVSLSLRPSFESLATGCSEVGDLRDDIKRVLDY